MSANSLIGDRLRKARQQLKLSSIYVANILGLTHEELFLIETSQHEASQEELQKFSELYGWSVEELVNGKQIQKTPFVKHFFELPLSERNKILDLDDINIVQKQKENHKKSSSTLKREL